jgi:hypothetical protein
VRRPPSHDVKSVSFNPDGSVVFEYNIFPSDAREDGWGMTHALLVPALETTADALEALQERCQRALVEQLEAFDGTEVVDFERILIEEELIEGEEASPYDNPTERPMPVVCRACRDGRHDWCVKGEPAQAQSDHVPGPCQCPLCQSTEP